MSEIGEMLRQVMRRWTTGVSVVTCRSASTRHGMTVNSFVSVSLEPPIVSVTLANTTRTRALVEETGRFGVSILNARQASISDRFAGRIPDEGDRFAGLVVFSLESDMPLIECAVANLDCQVIFSYPLENSTLYLARVLAGRLGAREDPLIYHNREYRKVAP